MLSAEPPRVLVLLVEGDPIPAELLPVCPVGALPEQRKGVAFFLLQVLFVDLAGAPQGLPPFLAAGWVPLHGGDAVT